MLLTKILSVVLILMCAISVSAWGSESGMGEDELYDIMFNQAYIYTDIQNPKWYDPFLTGVNDWLVSFEGYFTSTPPEQTVRVQVKKLIWTGAAYVEDTDFVDYDSSTYFEFEVNTTQSVQIPILKPIQEVFKNNTNEFDDFKTIDEDIEHPDILNVSVSVESNGGTLNYESYGYITFSNDALGEIENQMSTVDYGFALDGRGAGGGSGSIYEGVNMYGASGGDTSGMGGAFNTIFWCLIPLIFILAVMKLSSRVLK